MELDIICLGLIFGTVGIADLLLGIGSHWSYFFCVSVELVCWEVLLFGIVGIAGLILGVSHICHIS